MKQLLLLSMAGLALAGCMSPYGWSEAPLDDRYYASGAPVGWWGSNAASVDLFYSPLARYGRWDRHPRYGRVFVPAVGVSSWQPYSRGYWRQDPRHGRLWVSSEPFGWATYHYGRWGHDPGIGWYWVPDVRFGGSWVDWRYAGGSAAWAPLPPYGWDRYASRSDWWLWAPSDRLWSPGLHSHVRRGALADHRHRHDDRDWERHRAPGREADIRRGRPDRGRAPVEVARPSLPRPDLGAGEPDRAWQDRGRPSRGSHEGRQGWRESGQASRPAPAAGMIREANAPAPAARPAAAAPARPARIAEGPPPRQPAASRPAPSRSAEPATREQER